MTETQSEKKQKKKQQQPSSPYLERTDNATEMNTKYGMIELCRILAGKMNRMCMGDCVYVCL